jgi:hypothetical protein
VSIKRAIIILGSVAVISIISIFLVFSYKEEIKGVFVKPTPTPGTDTSSKSEPLGQPDELGKDFDQTKNAPTFRIYRIDKDAKTIGLEAIWPDIIKNLKVTSSIVCDEGDIKITSGSSSQNVTLDEFFSMIQETDLNNMLFSGVCGSKQCTEIVKSCQLFIL